MHCHNGYRFVRHLSCDNHIKLSQSRVLKAHCRRKGFLPVYRHSESPLLLSAPWFPRRPIWVAFLWFPTELPLPQQAHDTWCWWPILRWSWLPSDCRSAPVWGRWLPEWIKRAIKPGSWENSELDYYCLRINWEKVFISLPYKRSPTVRKIGVKESNQYIYLECNYFSQYSLLWLSSKPLSNLIWTTVTAS